MRRPTNPAHFNGTVIVEWMNVSAGESAPDWDFLNPMLMRDGYAYVGVSAQALGVDGGKSLLGTPGRRDGPAVGWSATSRPATARCTTPATSTRWTCTPRSARPCAPRTDTALGGLKPKHILAVGESQSAFYLTTFADAIQPRTNVYDGIFIHSRGGSGASLAGTSIASSSGPDNLRIRTDLKVPVFMSETQTDLIQLGYAPAQQPNTDKIRTWEIAGTSHADAYFVGAAASILGCTTPVNSGPQHNVVQAAFTAFDKWVDNGTPPPSPPPFKLSSTHPATLALDAHGNVIGGVRTPAVDVPVSTLSGAPAAGANAICSLFGSTVAFTPAQLASLYGTQEQLHRPLHEEPGQGDRRRGTSSARTRPRCWPRPSRCSSPADAGPARPVSDAPPARRTPPAAPRAGAAGSPRHRPRPSSPTCPPPGRRCPGRAPPAPSGRPRRGSIRRARS